MLRRDLAGHLHFVALVRGGVDEGDVRAAGDRRGGGVELTAGGEEPEAILQQVAAEGGFVLVAADARVFRLRNAGDRVDEIGLVGPRRVGDVVAERTAELIAARLGDRVDHAAGETAVLRRDAAGEESGLLDGVFDEEVLWLATDGVVHDDAVDHVEVVVRRSAVDDGLVVRTIVVDARRELDALSDGAAERERFDLLTSQRRRDLRRLEDRRCSRRDGDRFRHLADLEVEVRGCGLVEAHVDGPRHLLHAFQFGSDAVLARRDRRENVGTVGAAHARTHTLQGGRGDRDGGTRQWGAGRRDRAGNRARGLREGADAGEQNRGHEYCCNKSPCDHLSSLNFYLDLHLDDEGCGTL